MKPRFNPLFLRSISAAVRASLAGFAITFAFGPAFAGTLYWKGNAAATDWAAASSWTTDATGATAATAAPTTGDIAVFSSNLASGAQIATLAAARTVSGVSFINAGAKTIQSSNTTNRILTIGVDGLNLELASGDVSFAATAPVTLSVDQNWTIAGDIPPAPATAVYRIANVNGVLAGSGRLSKKGLGNLILTGNNTFTGQLNLDEGTLTLNNAGALGGTSNPLVIAGGTTLNTTIVAGITISAAKPITLNGNFTYTFSGTNATGNLNMGTGPVTLGADVQVTNTSGTLTFDGPVEGNFNLNKAGNGTLALMGANTYTGQTTVLNSSNLRFNGTAGFATTNVYLNGGALDLGGQVVENVEIVLGTAPGQVRMKDSATATASTAAHAGFSSASGHRKVSLNAGGVPNAPLIWGNATLSVGTPHFISGGDNSNGIILLSTPQAAGTIELTNDIDFSTRTRRFSIRDGSTTGGMPDAILSGKLTNGVFSTQGNGTVLLTNPGNSFTGPTVVTGGSYLRVPSVAAILGSNGITLDNGVLEVGDETPIVFGTGHGQVNILATGGGVSSYGTNKTLSFGSPTTQLVWGTNGFLAAGGNLYLSNNATDNTTTLANPIDLNGAVVRTIDVRNGAAAVDGALSGIISGLGSLTISGGGTLLLANEQNSYSGVTRVNAGSIVVAKLTDGGAASPIGSSGVEAANLVLAGGGLRYIGGNSSTNRLFTIAASSAINASGTGALVFSANGPSANIVTSPTSGTTTLSLTGPAETTNEIHGNLSNGTGTNVLAITKLGRTKWSLAGTNTSTGAVEITAGELILDYSHNGIPANPSAAGIHRIDNGNLTLKAKSTGTTTATINGIRFGVNLGVANNLKLDANGGDGYQLTLNTLYGNGTASNTQVSNFIDLSSSAGNSITVGALSGIAAPSFNGTVAKNVLVSNATADAGRSNYIVKDSTGYGFATLSGTTSGTIGRLSLADLQPLDSGNGAAGENLKLTLAETSGGTLLRTADLAFGTLTIDSTDGALTLDLGDKTLGLSGNNSGRGILVTGSNPVTISSNVNQVYSPFLYNYGSGSVTYNVPMTGLSLIAGGTGLIIQTATVTGSTAIYADGCVLRFAGTNQSLTGNTGLWVSNGGIIEIGTDLNGDADGVFTIPLGTSSGQMRIYGEAGISAHGGARVVNFGGATPATPLTWGASGFLTSATGADADVGFKLASPYSDSSVEIVNPINLGIRDRVFVVADGTVPGDVDAILSGVLSGPGAGVIKRGPGTLVLDAVNTYTGDTTVFEGVLRLTKASLNDQAAVYITGPGKLDLSHGLTDTVGALIINGTPVAPNIYGAADLPGILTGSGKLNVGGVPSAGTPYSDWATLNNLPAGKDEPEQDADDDGIKNIIEYSVGSDPMHSTPSVLTKAAGTSGVISFGRAVGRTDINSTIERSLTLAADSWTTIATSTAGAEYESNLGTIIHLQESAVTDGVAGVTLEDRSDPAPAKVFYRIRVTTR